MSDTFSQWTDRVDAAADASAQRALLAEIGIWRVRNLSDLGAQREAAYAIASLYAALDDKQTALREAENLMSLCRTPPMVSSAAFGQAKTLITSLGGKAGPAPREQKRREPRGDRPERGEQRERGERKERKERGAPGGLDAAVHAGLAGNWSDAFKALRGKSDPRTELVRTWLDLRRSLDESEEERLKRVNSVVSRLDKYLHVHNNATGAPTRELVLGSLEALIGQPLPGRRDKRLRIVDRFLRDNPAQIDNVASAALRDHVANSGPQQPAPWLVRYTALAVATGERAIRDTLNELSDKGAFAVSAYQETPFAVLVDLIEALQADVRTVVDLRRGVQREEPVERRLWTMRYQRPGNAEVMVVVAPVSDAPYPEGVAGSLAKRIRHLSNNCVLHAIGDGNAALREAAGVLGVHVASEGLSDIVNERAGKAAPTPTASTPTEARAATRESTPSLADLVDAAKELLYAEPVDHEALSEAVRPIRKVRDLFALVREPAHEGRLVALLKALHTAVPADIRLLEGTTLALRTAVDSGVEGAAAMVLTQGPESERYGGPGMDMVLPVATAVQQNGWELFRVLRGATRRERREHPVVDSLAEHANDLWRLLIRKDDERAELWVVGALAPEGRAVLPHLLLEDRKRVAVLPLDPEVLSGWNDVGGPEAIGWTGDTAEVIEALS